jgi:hypothetical protein
MYTVTYPFEVGQEINDQYIIIKTLTSEVLDTSGDFIGETMEDFQLYLINNRGELQSPPRYVYELLLLGCSWRIYYNTASTPGNSLKGMFSRLFRKNDNKSKYYNPEYNMENLDEVFGWMESKGEFIGELVNLWMWKDYFQSQNPKDLTEHLRKTIIFADWFKTSSKLVIGDSASKDERLLHYVRMIGFDISNRT